MGHVNPKPMAAAELTPEGRSFRTDILTIALIALPFLAWLGVGHCLATAASIAHSVAAALAASTISIAAIAVGCLHAANGMIRRNGDRFDAATSAHADRMAAITSNHSAEIKQYIVSLNWLMSAKFYGEQRAEIDANNIFRGDPSDSGPMPQMRRIG
ncbi:hypothetical protein [Nonomuraea wenchangensis]|uniref:hypothetical protein n=1 Tax=Nonomuraea wenchangensis TaxID=568860 RepID=UPI00331E233F